MELLRESDDPIADRETFFRAQIFHFLIGASDGHAKNFSLRPGRRGRFRLAPLYDMLSVAPVVAAGRLQRKRYRLTMSIDGHYGINEIVPRHFEAEGGAGGLPKNRALELLADLAGRLGPAIECTSLALTGQVPGSVSEPIAADSAQRANQVQKLLSYYSCVYCVFVLYFLLFRGRASCLFRIGLGRYLIGALRLGI